MSEDKKLEEIIEILLENGVLEEQNRRIHKRDGSILFIEGSYIQYLASTILNLIKEKLPKKAKKTDDFGCWNAEGNIRMQDGWNAYRTEILKNFRMK